MISHYSHNLTLLVFGFNTWNMISVCRLEQDAIYSDATLVPLPRVGMLFLRERYAGKNDIDTRFQGQIYYDFWTLKARKTRQASMCTRFSKQASLGDYSKHGNGTWSTWYQNISIFPLRCLCTRVCCSWPSLVFPKARTKSYDQFPDFVLWFRGWSYHVYITRIVWLRASENGVELSVLAVSMVIRSGLQAAKSWTYSAFMLSILTGCSGWLLEVNKDGGSMISSWDHATTRYQ